MIAMVFDKIVVKALKVVGRHGMGIDGVALDRLSLVIDPNPTVIGATSAMAASSFWDMPGWRSSRARMMSPIR
jgi:hypothetical protein